MKLIQRRFLPSTAALVTLDAVARLGSFSAAAEELNLTQGAVSRQIQTLEEQMKTTLFLRQGRGVTLTAEGNHFHQKTRDALALIQQAALTAMTGGRNRSLDLAILPTFGTRWLMPRIPRFVARHPEITLNFATRIGQFDFDTQGLDAAIHIGKPNWPGATAVFLMDETVAPVCSPDFLKRHAITGPEDLLSLPLIQMQSRPNAWDYWFETHGIKATPLPAMGFEQFMNVAQACIAGLGIALMPLFLIQPELSSGQLVLASEHRVKSQSQYYLVSPDNRPISAPLAAFSQWLLEEVRLFHAQELP
ncbi:LysR family transcriptional regulator [Allorhizobium sp. BGMRC 0089]|uniref:LysR family transcriptional regulator n=1 Tax=Allorhizobium sonneratiae TaxID=2934936 RepID=UPI0020348191|nr:LysR family transcriptional regulator [Allorhizobium sonneratiae]MCM2292743.1 LysR family transcriptional regulator [Allorhizobium sonneratiae]